MFSIDRYNNPSLKIFIVGNIFLFVMLFFEQVVFSWILRNIKCFKNIDKAYQQMDAISDNYYNEMNLDFLVSEYERTK